ncbi:MAG: DJ-1/PfpI family protein [Lentisphaerae bacterium]|nr:DJ-1/PfpI family protein [Lentisphaerota bacterium]
MAKVLVPLAAGSEEMETVIIVDTLRRAGWEVVLASVGSPNRTVKCSRGVVLLADADWKNVAVDSFDALVLPGGSNGTKILSENASVVNAVRRFHSAGKPIAAVCAGPLVLQEAGILNERSATCHPAVRSQLTCSHVSDERVVVDGNIVTSQGPGTSFEFALAVIKLLDGKDAADAVANALIL